MGFLSDLANIGGSILSYKAQKDTNRQNKEMWQQQFDYNKALQQQEWSRQDTAYTRAVADAKSAGLSPLAALGSSGLSSGSIVSTPGAPILESPNISSPGLNIDSSLDAYFKSRELDLQDKSIDVGASTADKDRSAANTRASMELAAASDRLAAKINSDESIADKDRLQRDNQFLKTFSLSVEAQTHKQVLESQRYLLDRYNSMVSEASSATGGRSTNFRYISDFDEYIAARDTYARALSNFVAMDYQVADKESFSDAESAAAAASAGVGVGPMGTGSGTLGGSGSRSDSASYSYDQSSRNSMSLSAFFARNPLPVYRP